MNTHWPTRPTPTLEEQADALAETAPERARRQRQEFCRDNHRRPTAPYGILNPERTVRRPTPARAA